MASGMENIGEGYDERRFEGQVRPDLLCSICHEVFNNPKTCQNKEHAFCLGCITQHLRISPTCPECREDLSPQTLKNAPRFLLNTLSQLKIDCEYKDRGCHDYVPLENLPNHINQCGFAPAMCKNEGCGMEVNKRDKHIHENDLCQFRLAKCHDCRDINKNMDELKHEIKASQDNIDDKIEQMTEKLDQMEQAQAEMKADQVALKAEMRQQFQQMNEMMWQILQGVTNNKIQLQQNKGQTLAEKMHEAHVLRNMYPR